MYKPTKTQFVYFLFILVIGGFISVSALSDQIVSWKGLGVVLLFYVAIFLTGIFSSKKNSTDDKSFLLAQRKLPLWIAMLTMAATWLGGGYINGTAEAAYSSGMLWVQAPWGYGISLIIGGLFFARKMRRYQFSTMLDPLSQRFGDRSTGLFFIPAVLGEIFWIAAILTALGTTFSVIIGLDTTTAIIGSALIAMLYTSIGGLWSVAYTDIIQLIFLVLGLFVALPYVLYSVGGIDALLLEYQETFEGAASVIPTRETLGAYYWNWWDYALLLIFGGIPWQVYFQRVLSAKNEKTAMWLSIFAGIICIVVAVPAAIIGMAGAASDWAQLGLAGPDNPASVLPYVLQYLTPEMIGLVGLGAIAAAVMSSIDSSMLSASSLAIWNVYRPLIKKNKEDYSITQSVRRMIIIIGTAATLLALKVESVYELWYLCSDFVYCLLFPALVTALFDPRANKIGALSGFAIAAFLRFGGGDNTLGLPILLPYPMIEDGVVLFPFRTLSMLAGLLTIIIVSRCTQHLSPPRSLVPMG